jgi:SAM-dependent methyltransferase
MDPDGNVGIGPGVITPDGCAVEFYALLPAMGEPAVVHSAVPDGASILELGCGTGRLLRPLAELGHPVLGVDESPAMLARIPDLPTVRSQIETLQLDHTFGAVLLASTMIHASPALRRAFLATCRRHVDPDGLVVIQQHPAGWFDAVQAGESDTTPAGEPGTGIRRTIRSADRAGPRLRVVVEYQVGGQVWTHAFSPFQISEDELRADLASAGLAFGRWLTDNRAWFTACPSE